MSRQTRNFLIIVVAVLSSLGLYFDQAHLDFTKPASQLQNHKSLKKRQLQTSFENMKDQFTPGYRLRVLGDDGVLRVDCRQGQIFATQTKTDMAINGSGFFCLKDREGKTVYTRDGRFLFENGRLCHRSGQVLLGHPLDSKGNISREETPIELSMDPSTKLYGGKYSDFRLDEAGTLYGVQRITDPVTGQSVHATTPLFAVPLAGFEAPSHLSPVDATVLEATDACGQLRVGLAGQLDLGRIVPGSLELSNVDYSEEGARISKVEHELKSLEEGTLFIRTKFSDQCLTVLNTRGVVVKHVEGLTSLEGRSRRHLFLSLNSAAEATSDSEEREVLLKAMEALEPRLVRVR